MHARRRGQHLPRTCRSHPKGYLRAADAQWGTDSSCVDALFGVSQPAVSKHLTVLKRAKLVRHRREGRETHYCAQPEALAPMVDWLDRYGAFWRERFDRLENLLKRMD